VKGKRYLVRTELSGLAFWAAGVAPPPRVAEDVVGMSAL